MDSLEAQLNAALQHRFPTKGLNHRHRLALDLHLLPYYGHPSVQEAPYIYRSQAKAGTTSFFAYANVYLIRRHHRVTLAIHPVRCDEALVSTITRLLSRLTPLKVKVQALFLNRGFYCVPVIRWLKARQLPFIMPAVICGKTDGTRQFCRLAFILVNIWIFPLWTEVSATRRGGRQVFQNLFSLKTLLAFLSQAVEKRFPPKREIYLTANL
jgi:hypothetical protein